MYKTKKDKPWKTIIPEVDCEYYNKYGNCTYKSKWFWGTIVCPCRESEDNECDLKVKVKKPKKPKKVK